MTYGLQEEMGRAPCCSKVELHKGSWTTKEDAILTSYVQANGEGRWRSLPQKAGLIRRGKSCRLRWMNYLRPGIKRGNITADEEDLIIRLQSLLGNRWSLIAGRLPGRTDNEIKNHWNTHILKRLKKEGIEPIESRDKHQLIKTSRKKPKLKNHTAKSGKQDDKISPMNIETIELCSSSGLTASSNGPVESLAMSGSSTSNNQKEVDKEEATREVWDISWSSFDQLDELSFIQEEVALNDNNLLEQVYNEYLQLL